MTLEHAATIAAAYLGNNTVSMDQVPGVIEMVHAALTEISNPTTVPAKLIPAVSIRKSIQADAITCLECGYSGQMLKRHLTTAHGLSPEQYRDRWNLPIDYPVVAPAYAQKRSMLAKEIGLGTAATRGRRGRR